MGANLKGQTSVEFMFLLGFMFVIFIVFFIVVQDRTVELNVQSDRQSLREINNIIKAEVRNAYFFDDGYSRRFWMPRLVRGRNYSMNLSDDGIEISYGLSGGDYLDFLDNQTFGHVEYGPNVVCKKDGFVHLNNCSE